MLRHSFIGTEHLLLGLCRARDAVAAPLLEAMGVTVERVREEVARIEPPGEEVTSGQIPFTAPLKKVMDRALREAPSSGKNFIGPEHLLLALLCEEDGVAMRILCDLSVDAGTARRLVRWICRTRIASMSAPAADCELEDQIESARRDKEAAIEAQDFEKAAALRDTERTLTNSRNAAMTVPGSISMFAPYGRLHVERDRPVLGWERASMLWRPEGLELRVPLHLGEGALASFATDEVWSKEPLASTRHEIWSGWLALASPRLLEDIDPTVLRRVLDTAAKRAGDVRSRQQGRVEDFLRRLQDDPSAED